MQREVFLIQNIPRLLEFLGDSPETLESRESCLGIGFFSSSPARPPAAGVELAVCPAFLEPKVLDLVAHGGLSPTSAETVLVGLEQTPSLELLTGGRQAHAAFPVARWLLAGVHFLASEEANSAADVKVSAPELADARNLNDAIQAFLRRVFSQALSIRSSILVFLVDDNLLGNYISRLDAALRAKAAKGPNQTRVEQPALRDPDAFLRVWMTEVLRFAGEDALHPRLVLLSSSLGTYQVLTEVCRNLVSSGRLRSDVVFRY